MNMRDYSAWISRPADFYIHLRFFIHPDAD